MYTISDKVFLLFQGLVEWDYTEPSNLARVIQELINQYKKYQVKLSKGEDWSSDSF